jgi:hypothetical protein
MSIAGDLVQCEADPGPEQEAFKESMWSRWCVPWLVAALGLLGLLVAAVAALEILTARPQRPVTSPRHEKHVEELAPDVELISVER